MRSNPGAIEGLSPISPISSTSSGGRVELELPVRTPGMVAAGFDRIWRLAKHWLPGLAARPQKRPRLLSVIEKLDLGPKKSVWIVAYGERHFLVAGGGETIGAALELGQGRGSSGDRIPVMTPGREAAN